MPISVIILLYLYNLHCSDVLSEVTISFISVALAISYYFSSVFYPVFYLLLSVCGTLWIPLLFWMLLRSLYYLFHGGWMRCPLWVGANLRKKNIFVLCNLNFSYNTTISIKQKWHSYTSLYREWSFYKNKLSSANVEAVSNFVEEISIVYPKR